MSFSPVGIGALSAAQKKKMKRGALALLVPGSGTAMLAARIAKKAKARRAGKGKAGKGGNMAPWRYPEDIGADATLSPADQLRAAMTGELVQVPTAPAPVYPGSLSPSDRLASTMETFKKYMPWILGAAAGLILLRRGR
jgi:hypothetical protein